MGKALMGAYATPRTVQLLDEVRALRQRVAQLEQALADAEAVRDARAMDELVTLDEAATVSR
ncbi:MAG: hypothetical protein KY461_05300 [Actinobacteria bacterium]|nr:hypothetical protein [Actinomycetota bacterium]